MVSLKRPELIARHRSQYQLDTAARARAERAAAKDPLLGLAYSPIPAAGWPLRLWATTLPPRAPGATPQTLLWIDSGDLQIAEYAVFVIDMTSHKEVQPPVGRRLTGSIPQVLPLEAPELPAGRYQFRVAVTGTRFRPERPAIAGFVLGMGATIRKDAAPLAFVPTLDRAFQPDAELRVGYRLWVRDAVEATTVITILDAAGGIVRSVPRPAVTDGFVNATVPLQNLAPGLYALQVTATSGALTATKAIDFSVVAPPRLR